MKLKHRRALVTGASQGFGLAVARAFIEEGADVMVCARSAERLDQARTVLSQVAETQTKVVSLVADVSNLENVQRLIRTAMGELGGLEILVCNAGVYGPKGPIQDVRWDDWLQAISINLMGTVQVCREVIPHLIRQKYGKIIILSGGGATKPLPYLSAYAASKAAVVRFSETLAEELRGLGIDVNAVAPGALNTRLLDEVIEAGPQRVGREFFNESVRQKETGGTPLDRGASLCTFLASSASDGITGKLLSAVWDPWEKLPTHLDELTSDIYTLRRIVPADRGKDWG